MKILVLNGPNLNMLGYASNAAEGEMTLSELEKKLATYGVEKQDDLELVFFQTNHEGQLIDMVQKASANYQGMIFNPSAYCHTSYALCDAVRFAGLPVVEVHLSNLAHNSAPLDQSLIAEVCEAQFMGKGLESYQEALDYLLNSKQ